ncbi:hypothetical protein D1839_03710 [Roseburia sp. 1XD42-34]|nr:hypothetical protein [Roseburia sp. 1XD42-34]RKI80734.1 hypothetical protein D7V87_04210 [Clostridium sp. 1xD42-85]
MGVSTKSLRIISADVLMLEAVRCSASKSITIQTISKTVMNVTALKNIYFIRCVKLYHFWFWMVAKDKDISGINNIYMMSNDTPRTKAQSTRLAT